MVQTVFLAFGSQTFELNASAEPTEPEGKSSHFSSSDPELHEWIDHGAEGALAIEIDGKSFTGQVAHEHDAHEGHDH